MKNEHCQLPDVNQLSVPPSEEAESPAEILEELETRKLMSPLHDDGKREILANFSQE